MARAVFARVAVLAMAVVAGTACGPRQTPEQRLNHIRLRHDIRPLASTTVFNQGEPTLLVDLMVVNQGIDALQQLTVLIRVRGADGVEKTARRVSLDLAGVRPGVAGQVAATVPGVELGENDEVTVELESNLPPEVLRELPEYDYVKGDS
jgi:hypothetical protein